MSTLKMNPDEFDIDQSLVNRLIAEQFPPWDELLITKVHSAGTDNAIYRLGDDMAVRLPRLPRAVDMLPKEQRWLPQLTPLLPLAIPTPLAEGQPDDEFPHPWSVYRWLDGEDLADQPDVDMDDVAARLGRFVAALRRIDPTGGPPSPRSGSLNSPPLDERVHLQIRHLAADGEIDADVVTPVWQVARTVPAWDGPPLWIHADLSPMNMLTRQGRLTAVIDFGLVGLGDPAHDMLPAWALLTAETRETFRIETGVDDATWARGRAWALCGGLGAMHFYRHTNPVLAATGRHAVTQVVTEYRRNA